MGLDHTAPPVRGCYPGEAGRPPATRAGLRRAAREGHHTIGCRCCFVGDDGEMLRIGEHGALDETGLVTYGGAT